MKRRTLCILLAAEAVILCLSHFFADALPGVFTSALAFPFEQIGYLLGRLSGLGAIGNGAAILLLTATALLPVLPVLRRAGDKRYRRENIALVALALILLPVLYLMSSPRALYGLMFLPEERMIPSIKMILGGSVWSVAACWLVLRLLRVFREGSRQKLLSCLRWMMYVLCALFVGGIAYNCLGQLLSDIRAAQLPGDTAMAAARFVVSALPYAADIAVVVAALGVLDVYAAGGISDDTVKASERLSRLSGRCLGAVALSGAVLCVLQTLLMPQLSDLRTDVNIPVLSLAFVLAALLFSRLIASNKRLSDDNDLFI